MSSSTPDPRARTTFTNVTWQSVAVSYALLLGAFGLLVAASYPVASAAAALAAALAVVAAPRLAWLVYCVRHCRRLTVDVAGLVSVTVTAADEDADATPLSDPCSGC